MRGRGHAGAFTQVRVVMPPLERLHTAMTTSAARIWPPAGAWIRRYFPGTGWATTRWHLFTGDAVWRLAWSGPSLETACGYRTGPLWTNDHLDVEHTEPDAACRLCVGRAWSKRLADPAF
jgi:hypothetical protein